MKTASELNNPHWSGPGSLMAAGDIQYQGEGLHAAFLYRGLPAPDSVSECIPCYMDSMTEAIAFPTSVVVALPPMSGVRGPSASTVSIARSTSAAAAE